jgi:hypothetical protein
MLSATALDRRHRRLGIKNEVKAKAIKGAAIIETFQTLHSLE